MAISDLKPENQPRVRKGPPCTVCEALATLPPGEAAALNRHLANTKYRYAQLSADLLADKDNPLDIQPGTLAKHARGGCAMRVKLR